MWNIIWIIIIGFIAGLIARMLSPGPNEPKGFILTTALGIAGAFVATFIGQAIGWYRPDQGAGFIAATLGGAHRVVHLEQTGGPPRHSRPGLARRVDRAAAAPWALARAGRARVAPTHRIAAHERADPRFRTKRQNRGTHQRRQRWDCRIFLPV